MQCGAVKAVFDRRGTLLLPSQMSNIGPILNMLDFEFNFLYS